MTRDRTFTHDHFRRNRSCRIPQPRSHPPKITLHRPNPPQDDPEKHLQDMPVDAHTGAGPALLAKNVTDQPPRPESLYFFQRLEEERPLPGRLLSGLML